MKQIALRLPDELDKKLVAISKEYYMSKNTVIIQAIKAYTDKYEEEKAKG
ncbi:MAG: hypothetical protein QM613_05890 [Micrococcaceae bacterium]